MKRLSIFIFILFFCVQSASAAGKERNVKDGNSLYEQKEYAGSLEKYLEALKKDTESAIINFDAGTAYYKNKKYGKAREHLKKALLSEDEALERHAHYNMGNSLYQEGISKKDTDLDFAVSSLEQALGQYESALSIDKSDEDAKINYEFVKKVLDELKKQQQERSKQCPLKDKKDSQGQKGQEKGSQQQKERGAEGRQEKEQDRQEKEQQGSLRNEEEQKGRMSPQESQAAEEKPPGAQSSADEETKAMTRKEAAMMLNDYQQNEEPKGMLDFLKRKGKMSPVMKDW